MHLLLVWRWKSKENKILFVWAVSSVGTWSVPPVSLCFLGGEKNVAARIRRSTVALQSCSPSFEEVVCFFACCVLYLAKLSKISFEMSRVQSDLVVYIEQISSPSTVQVLQYPNQQHSKAFLGASGSTLVACPTIPLPYHSVSRLTQDHAESVPMEMHTSARSFSVLFTPT